MILRLLCPSGHVLDVDARLAGRKIRCGACGAIMVVPASVTGPAKQPPARAPGRTPPRPPANPIVKAQLPPPAKPIDKPRVAPPAKTPAESPVTKPPVDLPPATAPILPRDSDLAAVPLLAVAESQGSAEPVDTGVRRYRTGTAIFAWLRKFWRAAEAYLPAGTTIPGMGDLRTALQLAAVLGGVALVSLLPVVASGHANLRNAPHWALSAVLLAGLQLVYAVWMLNAPDWVSARVQMVVCAVVTTIYGMLMTVTIITPANHPLPLELGDVRRQAPAWCGLMFILMGAATWFSGRTSARWRSTCARSGHSQKPLGIL